MSWYWYPPPKPRRRANGIKAQSKQFGKTWWAGQWLAALERLVDPARLSRGRSYARSGQVLNLDVQPGRVESRVQGSQARPYKVRIEIKALSDREWGRVADAMAAQAIFAAKLLAGEMPPDIETAFAKAKAHLFPASQKDLQTDCSCPDWANPCKHVAAVFYLLGEQFDADPFLLFRLRGKGKEEIVSMLRARRSASEPKAKVGKAKPKRASVGRSPSKTPAPGPQTTGLRGLGKAQRREQRKPESPPRAAVAPLEASLDHFWDEAGDLDRFQVRIEAPPVDAVPLKRLGAPGFWYGKEDFLALFEAAYQSVTQASLAVALGDEDARERRGPRRGL